MKKRLIYNKKHTLSAEFGKFDEKYPNDIWIKNIRNVRTGKLYCFMDNKNELIPVFKSDWIAEI